MLTPDATQAAIERVRDRLLESFDALAPCLIGVTLAEAEALLSEAVADALLELPPADGPQAA